MSGLLSVLGVIGGIVIFLIIFVLLIILQFLVFSNTIPWFRNSDDNPFKPSDEEPSFLLGKGWKGGKE